jgi:RNA polymerase sigma factor (sigma-70 family)
VHHSAASPIGTIERLARSTEPWLSIERCSSLPELETRLVEPDVTGWIHVVGDGGESPAEVVERAVRFRHRITAVLVDVSHVSRQFLKELAEADTSLVMTLNGFDKPGRQIRSAMRQRMPFSLGTQMLDALIPHWQALADGVQHELQQTFIEMRFQRSRARAPGGDSRLECEQVLSLHGLVSLAKVRPSLYALRVGYYVKEGGYEVAPAVRAAGGKDKKYAMKQMQRVFGIRDCDALDGITIAEMARDPHYRDRARQNVRIQLGHALPRYLHDKPEMAGSLLEPELAPLIFAVASRAAGKLLAKALSESAHFVELRDDQVQAATPDNSEEEDARERRHNRLQAAISQLPPQLGRVSQLYFLEELDIPAIAARLGISTRGVSNALSKARRRLADDLHAETDAVTHSPTA